MTQAVGSQNTTHRTLSPKAIVGIVLGILALVFVFQNTASGRVKLFFWELNAPGWLWMLVLFLAGVLVGSVFPWLRRRPTR